MIERSSSRFVHSAPELIRELVRFGANFDQRGGELALTTEGGTAILAWLMPSVMRLVKR